MPATTPSRSRPVVPWLPCRKQRLPQAACFRWPWLPKAPVRLAATCRPMLAVCRCCATATRANWYLACRSCYRAVRYGMACAACARTTPATTQSTCWLNVATPAAAVALLNAAKSAFDAQLTAFELISETALGLVLRHIPGAARPSGGSPWYVLAEFSDAEPAAVEAWLAARMAAGEVGDGVVAGSLAQARQLWALRECISEAQKIEGISIKHDVAVPVSKIPEFLERADAALAEAFPGIRVVAFGHVGDGNLHYNLSKADVQDNADFIAAQPTVNTIVHDLVHALNGSISAEHGIGQLKREEILRYKSPLEMALMRSIKQVLDPAGLMNPGKLL